MQSFFYIILKFGSINRRRNIISIGFGYFGKRVFFGLILFAVIVCVPPYNLDYLAHLEPQQILSKLVYLNLRVIMNRMHLISVPKFRII